VTFGEHLQGYQVLSTFNIVSANTTLGEA
jgi:hypothetical protein